MKPIGIILALISVLAAACGGEGSGAGPGVTSTPIESARTPFAAISSSPELPTPTLLPSNSGEDEPHSRPSLTYLERHPPGALPGGLSAFVIYRFQTTGLDGLDLRGSVSMSPGGVLEGFGRGPNYVDIPISPDTPAGLFEVVVRLPDGGTISATFDHSAETSVAAPSTGSSHPTTVPSASSNPSSPPPAVSGNFELLPVPVELEGMLAVLAVPDGLKVKVVVPGQEFSCFGRQTTGCYDWYAREAWSIPDLGTLGHEVCHANQHLNVLETFPDAGRGSNDGYVRLWLDTPQGIAFLNAFNADGLNWGGDAIEDFANVCYSWYLPQVGILDFSTTPALRSFSQHWLPK